MRPIKFTYKFDASDYELLKEKCPDLMACFTDACETELQKQLKKNIHPEVLKYHEQLKEANKVRKQAKKRTNKSNPDKTGTMFIPK